MYLPTARVTDEKYNLKGGYIFRSLRCFDSRRANSPVLLTTSPYSLRLVARDGRATALQNASKNMPVKESTERGRETTKFVLTCALRGGHVGAGLILEEEPAVVRAGVDVARRIRARAVAAVVRESHGSAKGARHGGRLLAEHGEQQRVPRNERAEGRQGVSAVAKSCKRKLIEIKRMRASAAR